MLKFTVIEKHVGTDVFYGRVVLAIDIDDAAERAIESARDDRFVVAVVDSDHYEAVIEQAQAGTSQGQIA
jgi:hypothetical protein